MRGDVSNVAKKDILLTNAQVVQTGDRLQNQTLAHQDVDQVGQDPHRDCKELL